MFTFLRASLIIPAFAVTSFPVQAFDNDFEINQINLGHENFLDLKAHRFRKSLEYQWYDSTTAWRITGASLDSDLAFLQTELKLQHELSDYLKVRLSTEQEVFYADKAFSFPLTEVEIYPWAGDFGFSLLGIPAYEKRDMDLGVALIWGQRPWNYTRFEYLDVDSLYNEKNVSDNTFYRKSPKTMKFEAAYQFSDLFGKAYKMRFSVSRDSPLELVDPDNNGLFKHRSSHYFLLLDYQPEADSVIGISLNGFTLDKSSAQLSGAPTDRNQQQATDYISADIYWLQGMGKQYEVRLGTQYDRIRNDIRDLITNSNDLNYFMDTLQVYVTAYHPFNERMAWDIGLYVGQVEEQHDFLQDNAKDVFDKSTEIKLRLGFEYTSSDGRHTLQFNGSFNVDGFFSNIGDGAGISFQSVF